MTSTKKLPDHLCQVIAKHANGATLNDILTGLEIATSQKRTVQRHLHQLIKKGVITQRGRGRSTRYVMKMKAPAGLSSDGSIPVSSQGSEVKEAISKPLSERLPVGYRPEFLLDYIPNKSYYLKADVREYFHEIGNQPNGNQPAATFAKQILNRLLIDLSWNSSRLEGNTYSLLETERLIAYGQSAENKNAFETRMILNHKEAIEFLVELGNELGLSRHIILNLHALLSFNLLGDPESSGRLRSIPVSIGKTSYKPLDIPQLITSYFQKILETADKIADPFEQSFFSMVHLPYLQPFVDVNKRVSRLASNIPLIKNNLCPISFVDVPPKDYINGMLGVYELNKVDLLVDVYVWAYERSTLRYSETRAFLKEPNPFIEKYASQIQAVIRMVVQKKLSKNTANKTIKSWTEKNISEKDRPYFIEIVETTLLALHEGNIAQYKIKLSEFKLWKNFNEDDTSPDHK